MSDKIEVMRGVKVEDDTPVSSDKITIMRTTPPAQDVEGQYMSRTTAQCPWCGRIGWVSVSSDVWLRVYCGGCGHTFRV